MKAVSGTQMRALDRRTIEETDISGEQLMEKAGMLAGSGILKWLSETGLNAQTPKIVILAGKGNNGGDAFVAARLFAAAGYEISLHCTAKEAELCGDALTMFRRMPASIQENISTDLTQADLSDPHIVIVDGLLGTGFHGSLRPPYRKWCSLVNQSGHPVAALDIPSGLDADNGEADLDAVTADITFTMAAPKTGMFSPAGIRHTGRLRVLEIGIPSVYLDELPDTIECTDISLLKSILKREPFDAHKYTRGHLFVAGGSKLYPGAPLLAAEAGLRTGAGLVTCCLPEQAEIHAAIPKALIVRRLSSSAGFFTLDSAAELLAMSDKAGAFAIGPGMGTAEKSAGFLEKMLEVKVPLLLDADALNLLSVHPELIKKMRNRPNATVLTPHPGEMKRLAGILDLETESRLEQAKEAAGKLNAYVIYKGPRTIVAAPDGKTAINLSGCPALATAGTGDILSGMAGAFLLNREWDVFDAVRAAVFLHGYTAELTA
ncbi:MAG: NAD(P)H-hydrate dehydratase, partial [Lentisphaeria bacterium]|nr:NAD(P)H-hydrate dehydratase [Lentisphaeria bacterium]